MGRGTEVRAGVSIERRAQDWAYDGCGVGGPCCEPWFLDTFVTGGFAPMVRRGVLRLPVGDGRIPLVDLRDVAEVAWRPWPPTAPPPGRPAVHRREAIVRRRLAAALELASGTQAASET